MTSPSASESESPQTEAIERDIDRDFILRGPDAVAYGLVDEILTKPDPVAVEALR